MSFEIVNSNVRFIGFINDLYIELRIIVFLHFPGNLFIRTNSTSLHNHIVGLSVVKCDVGIFRIKDV
ncbi:hypothetical protein D3C81_604100 [compost metagenome]